MILDRVGGSVAHNLRGDILQRRLASGPAAWPFVSVVSVQLHSVMDEGVEGTPPSADADRPPLLLSAAQTPTNTAKRKRTLTTTHTTHYRLGTLFRLPLMRRLPPTQAVPSGTAAAASQVAVARCQRPAQRLGAVRRLFIRHDGQQQLLEAIRSCALHAVPSGQCVTSWSRRRARHTAWARSDHGITGGGKSGAACADCPPLPASRCTFRCG